MRKKKTEISKRDIYRIMFRHKRKCLTLIALVTILTSYYLCFAPRSYLSEGKLFVRLGRENVALDPTATLSQGPTVAVPHSREDEINSLVDLLTSRALIEKVVDRLGPHTVLGKPALSVSRVGSEDTLSDREKAVISLEKSLSVSPVKKTNVIRVAYKANSPELAQLLVNELMNGYLVEHVKINRTPKAYEFLQKQTERIRENLTTAEAKLRDLQNQTGLSSLEDQRQLLVRRISSLQEELAETQSELESSIAETRLLRSSLSGIDRLQVTVRSNGLAIDNQATEDVRRELYNLQLREQELRAKYTDEHYEVIHIREQIAEPKKLFSKTTGISPDSHEEQITETPAELIEREPALASLAAKVGSLRSQLEAAERELVLFNNSGMHVAKLQREIELLDANYRKYSTNLEQSRIDDSMEEERISNLSIVQPATLNRKPVSPKRLIVLIAGFCAAFGGAVALALVAESLDHTCKSADDMETLLGIPTLATIPRLNHRRTLFISDN